MSNFKQQTFIYFLLSFVSERQNLAKIVFLAIFYTTFGHFSFAQNGEYDARLSLVYEQIRNFKQTEVYQSGGLNGEIFITEEGWCSLGYNVSFGKHTKNDFVLHLPLGWYIAQYPLRAINTSNDSWWIWGTLLCLVLPESVNFHIKLSDNFYISPYIAPAGIDMWHEYGDTRWEPTFAAGIRLNVLKDKWNLSPFLGVKTHYSGINWNQVQFGTMIGLAW
jgi:hypothetical protein